MNKIIDDLEFTLIKKNEYINKIKNTLELAKQEIDNDYVTGYAIAFGMLAEVIENEIHW